MLTILFSVWVLALHMNLLKTASNPPVALTRTPSSEHMDNSKRILFFWGRGGRGGGSLKDCCTTRGSVPRLSVPVNNVAPITHLAFAYQKSVGIE